jgi:phenylalanyl-tRNA synthetase alpha chain
MTSYLSADALGTTLSLRDVSDPQQGRHALQTLLETVTTSLATRWNVRSSTVRSSPLVSVEDNYDRLGFESTAVTRDLRYSRYVSDTVMLRTHTSAMIPPLLRSLAPDDPHDRLYALPGLVFRRDAIDRTHVGEPHQVDLWRVSSTSRLDDGDLRDMLGVLVEAVLPGAEWRAVPAEHPYTEKGRQLDVRVGSEWLELAECGLIDPALLRRCGLNPDVWSGLALGMGLDRAVMLRKGIDDIRLLRAADPRIQSQMEDLQPWRPVSVMPAIRRDISVVIDQNDDDETLGDRIRAALGAESDDVEIVEVLARTRFEDLPEKARHRLGLSRQQTNALIRIVFRPLSRTLTDSEANTLRNRIYLAVHEGPHQELI